jgi:hypothetical protein
MAQFATQLPGLAGGYFQGFIACGMKDPGNFPLKVNKTVEMTIGTAAPLEKR